MIKEIKKTGDIGVFTRELITEGVTIHPDDDFLHMVNIDNNKPSYKKSEAELRNELMSHCMQVCAQNEIDIYDFMMEIYLKETGLDKLIPPPSSPFESAN